jgi:undecaprenyl-diphosphatase
VVHPAHAAILGLVEGLTEFLPVSSTGHLILASALLGLGGEAVKTFEIVIQAGALGAVLGLYRHRVALMWRGLLGGPIAGRRLAVNLLASFLPSAVVGLLLREWIKEALFTVPNVAAALAAGGLLMIATGRRFARGARTIDSLTLQEALVIGLAQCAALWPGTSRSMVTILAGVFCGLSPVAAAEYSFLLALPTLGAATLLDAASNGNELIAEIGGVSVVVGFATAALIAAAAIQGLVKYLNRAGLAAFGWYRIALAAAIWMAMGQRG